MSARRLGLNRVSPIARLVGSSYDKVVLADSPIGYWRQGETSGTAMIDSSGLGRHGTYAGHTLGVPSLVPSLLGVDTSVTYSTSNGATVTGATWMDTTTSFSAECWVKTSNTGQYFYSRGQGGSWTGWLFGVQGGTGFCTFSMGNGGSTVSGSAVTGTVNVANNAAHHIVVTYDGANVILYNDGSQVAISAKTGAMPAGGTGNPITVGGINTGISHYLGCTMDEVAVYNTVLSAARVTAHYQAA